MRRYNWYYVVVCGVCTMYVYSKSILENFRYVHYGIIVRSTDSCVHAYTINRENVVS
jgi:hypothetical protein